jgi:hypothetical protein
VIDVGPPDGSVQPVLYATKNERGSYVALSHCWGSVPFITTTSETLAARETGIPLRDMPKTFRHAVYTTRTLQVRYLWIDSLCILQDSREEWEVESSKMAEYYGNSLFTIAADDASDASEGCFRSRNPLPTKPIEIKLKSNDIPVDKDVHHYIRHTLPPIHRSTLQTRGWTLQEEVLSRRLLIFGEQQLSFQCLLDIASESHPEGWAMSGITEHKHRPKYATLRRLLHSPQTSPEVADGRLMFAIEHTKDPEVKEDEKENFYGYWYFLVEDYCLRRLTKATDSLPALAGLAARFKEKTSDAYLAGLWKNDLVTGLLWHAYRPGERRSQYIGPSWSWLSVQAEIKFPSVTAWESPYGPPFEVQDAHSNVVGTNPFGEVDSGMIRVYGVTKLVCVYPMIADHHKTVFDPYPEVLEDFKKEVAQWPKWAIEEWTTAIQERKGIAKKRPSTKWGKGLWYHTGGIGTYHSDAEEPWFHLVWCLPVGSSSCLALVPAEDGHESRFKRVGKIGIGYGMSDYKKRTVCIV